MARGSRLVFGRKSHREFFFLFACRPRARPKVSPCLVCPAFAAVSDDASGARARARTKAWVPPPGAFALSSSFRAFTARLHRVHHDQPHCRGPGLMMMKVARAPSPHCRPQAPRVVSKQSYRREAADGLRGVRAPGTLLAGHSGADYRAANWKKRGLIQFDSLWWIMSSAPGAARHGTGSASKPAARLGRLNWASLPAPL